MKKLFFLSLIFTLALAAMSMPAGSARANSTLLTAAKPDATYTFTIVNGTGYGITKLFFAPASSEEWDDDEELLGGKTFASGSAVQLTYHAKKNASKWDIKVSWADGDDDSIWNNIDLNGVSKLTLKYDRSTNTASIARE